MSAEFGMTDQTLYDAQQLCKSSTVRPTQPSVLLSPSCRRLHEQRGREHPRPFLVPEGDLHGFFSHDSDSILRLPGLHQIWRPRDFSGNTFKKGSNQDGFLKAFVVFAAQQWGFHGVEVVVLLLHAPRLRGWRWCLGSGRGHSSQRRPVTEHADFKNNVGTTQVTPVRKFNHELLPRVNPLHSTFRRPSPSLLVRRPSEGPDSKRTMHCAS